LCCLDIEKIDLDEIACVGSADEGVWKYIISLSEVLKKDFREVDDALF
jgi:hypothetical protein